MNTSEKIIKMSAGHSWSTEKTCAVVILGFVMPFIVLGNAVIILAVYKYKRLQTITNYLLVSLAGADLGTGLFLPLLVISEVLKEYISDPVWCLVPHCLLRTVCAASVLCLAAIAFDRYLSVTRPLQYDNIMTAHKMLAFSVFAWVYSALIAWIPLEGFYSNSKSDGKGCSYRLIDRNPFIILLSGIYLPAYIIIFICYFRIFLIARQHSKAITNLNINPQTQIELQYLVKNAKYAITPAFVIGSFLACVLPYQVCIVIELVSGDVVSDWVQHYLALLSYCNSGINPWMYTFRNKDFKRTLVDTLYKCLPHCCESAKKEHNMKRQLKICGLTHKESASRRNSLTPLNTKEIPVDFETDAEDRRPSNCTIATIVEEDPEE